jgi:hypothetical protein
MHRASVVVVLAVIACKSKVEPKPAPSPVPAPVVEVLADGADMTFPSEPPVVETSSAGGITGGSRGGVSVWSDGSVRFTLQMCNKHPRRGKLAPERVTALVDALVKAGALEPQTGGEDRTGADCVSTSLLVRAGGKQGQLVDYGCGHDPGDQFKRAIQIVYETVGIGPCAYPAAPTENQVERAVVAPDSRQP